MLKSARILSLVCALALQVLPLARVIVTSQLPANSPYQMVFRIVLGAVALLGSHHAVSGASNTVITSPTSVTGTVGRAFSYRILLSGTYASHSPAYFRSTVNGVAQPGQALNVPAPGLVAANPNTSSFITGTPTRAGVYSNYVWASSSSIFKEQFTSNRLTITILDVPKPKLAANLQAAPGQFSLAFQSTPNFPNIVEYHDALATNGWQVLTNIPSSANAQSVLINDSAVAPRRFYRVRLGP